MKKIRLILNKFIKKVVSEESILYFFSSGVNRNLILMKDFGYLKEVGWELSVNQNLPIDKNKKPIPWYSYPAIDFLIERTHNNIAIFEYGCGHSTLFFLEKVSAVYGVESDGIWFEKIILNSLHKSRCKFILSEIIDIENYVRSISHFSKKFDLIAIDGFLRNDCVFEAIHNLSNDGVIIFDDSQLDEYQISSIYLQSIGFKELKFWGMAPIIHLKKCTSIFYRENNCFGI